MAVELILGGARSGKSRHAEQRAQSVGGPVTYIATGWAGDAEMAERIAHHRAQRPAQWACIEEPVHLADQLMAQARAGKVLLVDCLTLWLSNAMFHADPTLYPRERQALLEHLPALPGHTLLVSNEVGWGIVPMGADTRRYVDEAGRLHQAIASLASKVTLVVAGLPLSLKDTAHDD